MNNINPLKHTVVGIDIGPVNYSICKVTAINEKIPFEHGDDLTSPQITKTKIDIGYWKKHNLLEGTEHTNAMKVPITTLVELLIKKLLDIIPELLSTGHKVDGVLIENQIDNVYGLNNKNIFNKNNSQGFHQEKKDPKGINVSLSAATYTFFKTLKQFGIENDPPSYVMFQNSKHKYKLIHLVPGIDKKETKEKNMFVIQRIKQMLNNKNSLKEQIEKYSKSGEIDPYFDRAGIMKNLAMNNSSLTKAFSSYEFNKKLGPSICEIMLVKFDLDIILKWFNNNKKRDDYADSFAIALYQLIENKCIVDFSTQNIIKTIKKPRKKRSTSTKENTNSKSKTKKQKTKEIDLSCEIDNIDDFNILEKCIDL